MVKTYTATKPSLKIVIGRGKMFEFKESVLTLTDESDIAIMDNWLLTAHPAARSMVKTVSFDTAKKIAEEHRKTMGPAAIQGPAQAGLLGRSTKSLRDMGIALDAERQNLIDPGQVEGVGNRAVKSLGTTEGNVPEHLQTEPIEFVKEPETEKTLKTVSF